MILRRVSFFRIRTFTSERKDDLFFANSIYCIMVLVNIMPQIFGLIGIFTAYIYMYVILLSFCVCACVCGCVYCCIRMYVCMCVFIVGQ